MKGALVWVLSLAANAALLLLLLQCRGEVEGGGGMPNAAASGGKRVVSFSLYNGHLPRYGDGARRNAALVGHVFPGWLMRVYHDGTAGAALLGELEQRGVELVDMAGSPLTNPMTWRFLAASDPTVERFIVRDIDSRLCARDKAAVDEWVASGRRFHVMRDHPAHSDFKINGGMWGGTRDAVPDMKQRLLRLPIADGYRFDMTFLDGQIWPIARQSIVQHDSYSCDRCATPTRAPAARDAARCAHRRFEGAVSFPTQRRGWEHVGQVFLNAKDKTRRADIAAIKAADQPDACRDRDRAANS